MRAGFCALVEGFRGQGRSYNKAAYPGLVCSDA